MCGFAQTFKSGHWSVLIPINEDICVNEDGLNEDGIASSDTSIQIFTTKQLYISSHLKSMVMRSDI